MWNCQGRYTWKILISKDYRYDSLLSILLSPMIYLSWIWFKLQNRTNIWQALIAVPWKKKLDKQFLQLLTPWIETYNDSSNRVHPISNIISKESSNESNNVGDNINKVV